MNHNQFFIILRHTKFAREFLCVGNGTPMPTIINTLVDSENPNITLPDLLPETAIHLDYTVEVGQHHPLFNWPDQVAGFAPAHPNFRLWLRTVGLHPRHECQYFHRKVVVAPLSHTTQVMREIGLLEKEAVCLDDYFTMNDGQITRLLESL